MTACSGVARQPPPARSAAHLGRTRAAGAIFELAAPDAFDIVHSDPGPGGYLAYAYSFASVLDGRIDEATAVFETLLDLEIVRVGGPLRALPTFWLGRATLAQGRVSTATRLRRDALDILGDENHFETGTWVAATLATAAAHAGDIEAATTAVAWIDAHTRVHVESDALFTNLARAWLSASRGELSTARDIALDVAQYAGKAGAWTIEMTALLDVARLGAPRLATPRLAELAQIVEGPYAAAAAGFARAAAAGDGAGLDEAGARFAAMGARLLAAEATAAAADPALLGHTLPG